MKRVDIQVFTQRVMAVSEQRKGKERSACAENKGVLAVIVLWYYTI